MRLGRILRGSVQGHPDVQVAPPKVLVALLSDHSDVRDRKVRISIENTFRHFWLADFAIPDAGLYFEGPMEPKIRKVHSPNKENLLHEPPLCCLLNEQHKHTQCAR